MTQVTSTVENVKKGIVLTTLNNLLKTKNTLTAKEIKDACCNVAEHYYWTKDFINTCLKEFAEKKIHNMEQWLDDPNCWSLFSKKDSKVMNKVITPKEALEMICNSKGHFFSVMFKKKTDKTTRNINCQYVVGQKRSGNIIKVKESGLLKKGLNPIRSFDYTTIQELRMNKTTYSVK